MKLKLLATSYRSRPCIKCILSKSVRNYLAVMAVTVIATHPLYGPPHPPPGTPEIDPGMSMAGLAFLGGAILVIRGRVKL